jgi:methyltransferase (TIGR00027 family)
MPSTTAELMALFRALESVRRPAAARLFEDPWAAGFLRPSLRAAVWVAGLPVVGGLVSRAIDARFPGARSSGVARTRWIDDELRAALAAGARQVAILGAGFDARALRLPELSAARVFELDEASTSRAKQARLLRRGALPAHVTFVAADFERATVDDLLRAAGFDVSAQSVVLWEGVTNYLTAEAVDATLRGVARLCAPGSRLVFTYVHRGLLDGSPAFGDSQSVARLVRRVNEPWTFGLDPAELPAYLHERGLALVRDVDSVEYRSRLLGPHGPHLRGYEFYHCAVADVLQASA